MATPKKFGGTYWIRTNGAAFAARRFSKPVPSTTRPMFLVLVALEGLEPPHSALSRQRYAEV